MADYTHCSVCGEEFAPHLEGAAPGAEVSHMRCVEREVAGKRFEHYELLKTIDEMADSLGLEYAEEFVDDDIVYIVYREDADLYTVSDLLDLYRFLSKAQQRDVNSAIKEMTQSLTG